MTAGSCFNMDGGKMAGPVALSVEVPVHTLDFFQPPTASATRYLGPDMSCSSFQFNSVPQTPVGFFSPTLKSPGTTRFDPSELSQMREEDVKTAFSKLDGDQDFFEGPPSSNNAAAELDAPAPLARCNRSMSLSSVAFTWDFSLDWAQSMEQRASFIRQDSEKIIDNTMLMYTPLEDEMQNTFATTSNFDRSHLYPSQKLVQPQQGHIQDVVVASQDCSAAAHTAQESSQSPYQHAKRRSREESCDPATDEENFPKRARSSADSDSSQSRSQSPDRGDIQMRARKGQEHWAAKVKEMRAGWETRQMADKDPSFARQIQRCSRAHIKSQHECLLRELQFAKVDGLIYDCVFSQRDNDSFLGWKSFRIVKERSEEFLARIHSLFPTPPIEATLNNVFRRAGLIPDYCPEAGRIRSWSDAWAGYSSFAFSSQKRASYS